MLAEIQNLHRNRRQVVSTKNVTEAKDTAETTIKISKHLLSQWRAHLCQSKSVTCSSGPPSPPGPPGTKGARGRRGQKGRTGNKGDRGIMGSPGKSGKQGIEGPAGLMGGPGTKGEKGDMGLGIRRFIIEILRLNHWYGPVLTQHLLSYGDESRKMVSLP